MNATAHMKTKARNPLPKNPTLQVEFSGENFQVLADVAQELGITPEDFIRLAVQEKLRAHHGPVCNLESAMNQSVAFMELLTYREVHPHPEDGTMTEDWAQAISCGIAELHSHVEQRLKEACQRAFCVMGGKLRQTKSGSV